MGGRVPINSLDEAKALLGLIGNYAKTSRMPMYIEYMNGTHYMVDCDGNRHGFPKHSDILERNAEIRKAKEDL